MSKYTTQVRFICESKAGFTESQGGYKVDEIIKQARLRIFAFEYPLFDSNYAEHFETMILRHFYTREIAYETYGLWQLKLWDKLNLIMPYYNKMYESELLQFNPLYDCDYQILHSGEGSGSNQDNISVTETRNHTDGNTRWDLFSDTPQGGIDVITNENDGVANNTYLTDARKITDNGSANDTNTSGTMRSGSMSSTDSYIDHVIGKRGNVSYAKLIQEFRKTFLRIDEMVCEELEPLFFGLW